jgi:hypothetical protein
VCPSQRGSLACGVGGALTLPPRGREGEIRAHGRVIWGSAHACHSASVVHAAYRLSRRSQARSSWRSWVVRDAPRPAIHKHMRCCAIARAPRWSLLQTVRTSRTCSCSSPLALGSAAPDMRTRSIYTNDARARARHAPSLCVCDCVYSVSCLRHARLSGPSVFAARAPSSDLSRSEYTPV